MGVTDRLRRTAAVGLIGGVLAVAVVVPAVATQERTVLNDVHTDVLDVRYENGKLGLRTRVGSDTYREPADLVFQLKDTEGSRIAVPDVPEYAFLGAPGAQVLIAPQVQDPALLFAGWDTEGVPAGALAGDTVDLRVVSAVGPGPVEVFQTDAFGLPLRVFSSTDPAHRTLRQAVHSHVHANWSFGALGWYTLVFEATATDAAGVALRSEPVTYRWYVGGTTAADVPADPDPDPGPGPSSEPTTQAPTPGPTSVPTSVPTSAPPTTVSAPTAPTPSTTDSPCVPAPRRPVRAAATVIADGHVDFGTRIVAGALRSQIKDPAGVWRSPADVVLHVVSKARTTVPAGFDFLGAAGSATWQIPQTQAPGVLWLGWNTEALTGQITGDVTWTLDRAEGPGTVAVFEFDPFGRPRVLFNSGDGTPDRLTVRAGTHAHGNWAFTKEGRYRLTFTQTATLTGGAQVRDTQVLTFAVGPPPVSTPTQPPVADPCATASPTPQAMVLARTGATTPALWIGVLLLVTGAACLALARRRGVR